MDSLVIASVLCVANAKMQDTTYEVARDIVLNTLEEYKNKIDNLNKGIDDLIKNAKQLEYEQFGCEYVIDYVDIQDIKKLKGE